MRFEFHRHESLPRLAWCARLRRGDEVVRIDHGPWVETRGHWFVEGAWAGDFVQGDFENAIHLAGSAGRADADCVVFCTASNMMERVQSVRVGDDLLVSNSLVFLFEMTGDEPDPCYPFYFHELWMHNVHGIRWKNKTIPTARGRHVELHDHCRISIDRTLYIRRIEKPVCPPLNSYEDVVGTLEGAMRGLLANAADPARSHRYRPLATVSRGYDANALATLVTRLGGREAMTFFNGRYDVDNGEEIARMLGMSATVYDRHAFRKMPGMPEAEFHAYPKGTDVVLAPCADQLESSVMVVGRFGDIVFSTNTWDMLPDLMGLFDHPISGMTLIEFRLRVGFVYFDPCFVIAMRQPELMAISKSPEMRPWSVGGVYDRPIPRRLLEEAGVPRGAFAREKGATAHCWMRRAEDMSEASAADFTAYRAAMPKIPPLRAFAQRSMVHLRSLNEAFDNAFRRPLDRLGFPDGRWEIVPYKYQGWDDSDFMMHWGVARIRSRYALAERVGSSSVSAPERRLVVAP